MTPVLLANGTHPRLQWLRRGTPTISLTEPLATALPVTVLDAEAYYHSETDTFIVVPGEVVQTVLDRNGAPLPALAPAGELPHLPHLAVGSGHDHG